MPLPKQPMFLPDTPCSPETGLSWLRGFVARQHPNTGGVVVERGSLGSAGSWQTLRLTSQTWRGDAWRHTLDIVMPASPAATGGPMILWIDGGRTADIDATPTSTGAPPRAVGWLAEVVTATGLPAAVVRQVPSQPACGGLMEDDLVAHTFAEFVRSGDREWPILLPMVKAVVAAMDVAGEVAAGEGFPVAGFVLGGLSKRGWTAWLAAAADSRVVGLVPAVIDMLRLERHVPLQLATFGGRMSEMLDDYTSRGIEHLVLTPRGRDLIGMIDPWSHRAEIRQPKIVALGTNDPYWPLGALDLYLDGLAGLTAVSYAPNAGHGIPATRLSGLLAALLLHTAGRAPLPLLRWSFEMLPTGTVARLTCDEPPAEIVCWQADADGPDFRTSRWTRASHAAERSAKEAEWIVPLPAGGERWRAALVECRFERAPHPLWLTTSVHRQGPASLASSSGSR